ncbi:MAG: hypothetical protein QG597_1471 [Actinomycetota bacterium]|nr:hypothetical protein [Actinomycetota bacterium]
MAVPLVTQFVAAPKLGLDSMRAANFHNRRVLRDVILDCNCCGSRQRPIFSFLPLVHFERLGTSPLRDNIMCAQCHSSQRTRALLAAVLATLDARPGSTPTILDLDDAWSGGAVLSSRGMRQATTFDPARPWGEVDAAGVRNEDLAALTFEDEQFDVVVSAEVHEHIEDTMAAFAEVHRVLRPGGTYVFTLPFDPTLAVTKLLAVGTEFGPLWTGFPQLHRDPRVRGGITSYWLFGQDLAPRLAEIGFEAQVDEVRPPGSPPVPVHVFSATKVG